METQWKDKILNGVTKSKEKVNELKNMSKEERKEKANEYIGFAKEQGKEFVGDLKNFKALSKEKKKKTVGILAGVLILVCVLFSMLIGGVGSRSLSPEQKIELAKNLPLNYFPAGDLISSGGLTYVMWTANEDSVKATRDNITFEFVVTSSGEAYLENVRNTGETLSEPAIEAVLDSYYDIGVAAGTLK